MKKFNTRLTSEKERTNAAYLDQKVINIKYKGCQPLMAEKPNHLFPTIYQKYTTKTYQSVRRTQSTVEKKNLYIEFYTRYTHTKSHFESKKYFKARKKFA